MLSVNNIQQAFNSTYNGTKTGVVTDMAQGSGTYSNTVSHQNGVATSDDLTTYANGATTETKTSITKDADGGFDKTIQKYVDGKEVKSESLTTSADGSNVSNSFQLYDKTGKVAGNGTEVITGNTDGSETITGSQTWADGKTNQITGALSVTGSTVEHTISISNAAGQTAAREWQNSKNAGTVTDSLSATDFAGATKTDTNTRTRSNT